MQFINRSLLAVLLLLPCIAMAIGKDVRSLQKISPRYFDLSREYSPEESQLHTRNGRVFAGPTFCKGRYIANYKDRSGTYFAPPEACEAPLVLGVWVPDDPAKDPYDTWLIIKKSSISYGLLVDWLDSLEAGNYAKSGFSISGPELIEEFKKIQEFPPASP